MLIEERLVIRVPQFSVKLVGYSVLKILVTLKRSDFDDKSNKSLMLTLGMADLFSTNVSENNCLKREL